MDMQFYTYIIECSDGSYYVGKTKNIEKRISQHNGILRGGAKYSRSRRPVRLVYYELFTLHKAAAHREYELKQLTHEQKKQLVLKK